MSKWILRAMAAVVICGGMLLAGVTIQGQLEVANLPPTIPVAFAPHTDLDEMARAVMGDALQDAIVYIDKVYPGGRTGYSLEITVKGPELIRRRDILWFGYRLAHEFYYNSIGFEPMYISIFFFPPDIEDHTCAISFGIGYASVPAYLPKEPPDDIEVWFSKLQEKQYYGDMPGQNESLKAFGNDVNTELCELNNWKPIR